MIFKEAIRNLEKGGLTAHELFDVMCRFQQNSYSENKWLFFFFEKLDCFKTQKMAAKLNRTFSFLY